MDKRNFIKTFSCLLLASLMLGACEENGLPAVLQPQEEALRLQSVDMTENAAAFTRASVTSVTAISVYATTTAHAAYGSNPSSKYSSSGGNWSSTDAPMIATLNGNAYLYACHPVVSSVDNSSADGNPKVSVSVNATADSKDFKATGQNDYLYAVPVDGGPNTVKVSVGGADIYYTQAKADLRTVRFSMNHALAKVSFKVKKSNATTEVLTLKSIEIVSATGRLQTGTGTMNLHTGALNGLASTSLLKLEDTTGAVLEAVSALSNPNVTCLVAPMSGRESILSFRLTVRVSGESADRAFETKVVTAIQWAAGNHYIYTITVDKMKAGLNGMQIDDWKNDASQNTNIGI